MKLYKYIVISLLSLLPSILVAQTPVPKGKSPLSYEKFFKEGMTKIDGVIPVYLENGKCYIELSKDVLGKDLLASGIIAKGPWFGTPSVITDVFKLTKGLKNDLNFIKTISSDVIGEDGDEGIAQAINVSTLQPVTAKFPIHALSKDKKGYIVDMTKEVTSNGIIFSFPNLQWVNRPDAGRSYLESAKATENGVKFYNCRTQTDYMPSLGGSMGYDKNNTVVMEWGIQVLPQEKMRVRLADARVGYASFTYNDYGVFPYSVRKTNVIRKWNLQPSDLEKYNRNELVEPANPIIVDIDKTVPKKDYPAIESAVKEWNSCFEKAGFKNAIKIHYGGGELYFANHKISIIFTNSPGKSTVATVSDPRTGEILSSVITYMGYSILTEAKGDADLIKGLKPITKTDNLEEEARLEIVRCKVEKLIGTTLGLKENFAGSYAYTSEQLRNPQWVKANGISASIMDDCIANFAVQPTDKQTDFSDFYSHVSHYDKWAIEWGYRIFPDNKDENQDKNSLSTIISRANSEPFLLYIDSKSKDYRAVANDLGQDKVKVAELVLENIKRAYADLAKMTKKDFEENETMGNVQATSGYLNAIYNSMVASVRGIIGGYTVTPVIRGYNEKALAFAPKSEQMEAIHFIRKYVMAPPAPWMEIDEITRLSGNTPRVFTTGIASTFMFFCIDPNTINILLKAENELGTKAFTTKDLQKEIENDLFFNFSPTKKIDSYYRNLQFNFVGGYSSLLAKTNFTNQHEDITSVFLSDYKRIFSKIKHLSATHSDPTTRNHFKSMARMMENEVAGKNAKPAGILKK